MKKLLISVAALAMFAGAAFAQIGGPGNPVVVGGGGGGAAPDLSAYALLAGDADGQMIQGRTGENQARIDIGGSSSSQVAMHGTGLLHGVASVDNEGAYLYSADSGSYVYAIDSEGTVIGSTVAIRLIYGQTPPTNANDPCTAGDTIDTATFHYYCAATDTWVRVAMATWP